MLLYIFIFLIVSCTADLRAGRGKRFLDNRINVLEQAHSTHRNLFIGGSVIIGILFLAIVFLCYRYRRSVNRHQTHALQAIEESGLSSLHPFTSILMNTLRRLDTLDNQPPPSRLNQISSYPTALPPLKF